MNAPKMMNARPLPIVTGASTEAGFGGGARPESITTDVKGPAKSVGGTAAPAQAPIPASITETVADVIGEPEIQPSQVAPTHVTVPHTVVADEEIDALHARFDKLEALVKRRLALKSLDARFDALEKYLNERF